jgi:hypothetical protein
VRISNCLAIVTLFGLPSFGPAQDFDVLQLAKTGQTQARQSIHSIRATINTTTRSREDGGKETTRSCQWVQSGNSVRWELTKTSLRSPPYRPKKRDLQPASVKLEEVTTNVQKDGNRTTIRTIRQDDKVVSELAIMDTSTEALNADLWTATGFNVLDNPRTSLLEVLEKNDGNTTAAWAAVENRKMLLVRYVVAGRTVEAYLAPEYGYLVQRMLTTVDDGNEAFCFLREISQFKEFSPGLFFPTKALTTYYRRDSGVADYLVQSDFTIENVQINVPVDPAEFELKVPAGTRVVDKTKDVGYVMGQGGKPDSAHPVLPIVHSSSQVGTVTAARPRLSKSLRASLIVGGGVFVAMLLFFRYVRARRAHRAR